MSKKNNWKKYIAKHNEYEAIIEEDLPDVGWLLHIFINGKSTYDAYQDNVQFCKEEAFEEFGIPLDSWKEIK